MKNQQGAALIVVLVLLTISLMLGLSSVQSSLVDERLAGNYKAAAQAQMNAEQAASEMWHQVNYLSLSPVSVSEDDFSLDDYFSWGEFVEFANEDPFFHKCRSLESSGDGVACYIETYYNFRGMESGSYIVALGAVGAGSNRMIAVSDPVFVKLVSGKHSPFSGITGCERIDLDGGGRVVGYDSSKGRWDSPSQGLLETTFLLNTETQEDGEKGNIYLSGGGLVEGGVKATGNIYVTGGGRLVGDLGASGSINIDGGVRVSGGVEAGGIVEIAGGSSVLGMVKSNENIFISGGSDSGGVKGKVDSDDEDYAKKYSSGDCDYFTFGRGPNGDPVKLVNEFERYLNVLGEMKELDGWKNLKELYSSNERPSPSPSDMGQHPFVDWVMTPDGLAVFDETWDKQEWVEMPFAQENTALGVEAKIIRVDDFKLMNGSLKVSGGDVVLFVDGDFVMGKGGSTYEIDDDSSLTVFVNGEVDISHGANMDDTKTLTADGKPKFSIFSSGENVSVTSSGKGVANIYAPYSHVSINSGGSFFGSLRGRTLEVTSGGAIAYDTRLGNATPVSGDGSDANEIISWE